MATSNQEHISNLRNKLDSIQENAEFDRQIIATGIFEAWEMLAESTLMDIVGKDQQGRNLVKYLHRFHKVSDTANFEVHPLKVRNDKGLSVGNRVMLKPEKTFADNILLLRCEKGWAFMKVKAEEQDADKKTKVKKGDPENTSQNYEFYVATGSQILDDKQVDAAISDLEKNRTSRGSNIQQTPDYYRRNTPRGGRHFAHEPENNAFDRIREIIGDVISMWNATERESYNNTPEGKYRAMAMKKLGIDAPIPGVQLTPDQEAAIATEIGNLRNKFDLGQGRVRPGEERPKGASIEAGKIASRAQNNIAPNPANIIAKRFERLLPSILTQVRIAKRRANPDDPAIAKIGQYMKDPALAVPLLKQSIYSSLTTIGLASAQAAANGDPSILQNILASVRSDLAHTDWARI